jgi:ferritin
MAKLNKKMQKALNDQMNFEISSGYLYWAMAAWFEGLNLPGFANWMFAQHHEEISVHARRLYSYLIDRGAAPELDGVEKPPAAWASPLAAFEAAYAHELKVTDRIYKLAELAKAEGDLATFEFLQWFIGEQVEEEKQVDEIVQLLKLAGDKNVNALFMINAKLGERKFGG